MDLVSFPWTRLANKMKTKSKDDCRNKWYSQVMNTLYDNSEFDRKEERALINSIRDQEVDHEREIDFADISNGKTATENKHYWEKLKKLVSSRYLKSVDDSLKDMVEYFKKEKLLGAKRYSYGNQADESEEIRNTQVSRISLLSLYRQKTAA